MPNQSIVDLNAITLIEAAKLIPNRPHVATIKRWCTKGYRGVILESMKCGQKRFTTIESIDKFIAATNDNSYKIPTKGRRRKTSEKLNAIGV